MGRSAVPRACVGAAVGAVVGAVVGAPGWAAPPQADTISAATVTTPIRARGLRSIRFPSTRFDLRKRTYDSRDPMSFLTKLADASRARDTILCVGLDPEPDRIPDHLGSGAQAAVRFLRRIVRATSGHVCAYKPT